MNSSKLCEGKVKICEEEFHYYLFTEFFYCFAKEIREKFRKRFTFHLDLIINLAFFLSVCILSKLEN